MDTPFKLPEGSERIVYVRKVATNELPDHIKAQATAHGVTGIYGVFGADGAPIAITPSRAMAFDLARENELTPCSVH